MAGRAASDSNRIIHVAESFAGGVSAAIRDYVRNAPEYEHGLVYAPRSDAPMNPGDLDGFAFAIPLPPGHMDRVRAVRRISAQYPGSVIHAHSSFGGFYARLAFRRVPSRPILYTPHCYAFERRDVSAPMRAAFRTIEWVLALNTTAFLGCSIRETQLSRWPLSAGTAFFVPNVPPRGPGLGEISVINDASEPDDARPLIVAAGGRLGAQKDPDYFAGVVRALRAAGAEIDPVWIGGGEPDEIARLEGHGIRVTGWLERERSLEQLRAADVYVHGAKWEGFPLAILEAAMLGTPAIVRRIPAFDGVALPVFIDQPADAASAWSAFETSSGRSRVLRDMRSALAAYTDEGQSQALRAAYSDARSRLDAEVSAV